VQLPLPRFRPTLKAVAITGAAAPVTLLLVIADPSLWVLGAAFGLGMLLLIGLDALQTPDTRDLAVEVKAPPLLYIGDPDPLEIAVGFVGSRRPTVTDMLCDMGRLLTPQPAQRHVMPPDAPAYLEVALAPLRRGTARVERLWFRWRGPYGLIARQQIVPVRAEIAVVPNIRAVRNAAISLQFQDAFFGSKVQKQQGDGSEYSALREYVPGLDHRAIDWKQSARHRKLVCKEFQTERNHQIVLAFDTGQLMAEPIDEVPRLDHAINAGLLLGYMSTRAGDRIGLFGFDAKERAFAEPVGGRDGFLRLQRQSASLDYATEETNFTLGLASLLTRLNRRSLVVLMTEFTDTVTAELMVENVARLVARHVVICVTLRDPDLQAVVDQRPGEYGDVARSVIAADLLRERRIVQERLRRLGVHWVEAPWQQVGPELIDRYLQVKRLDAI